MKAAIGDVTLTDAGIKNKYGNIDCSPKSKIDYANKISYPCLYISTKEVPSIKGYDVDEMVTMVISARITSHSVNKSSDGRDEDSYTLEIQKTGMVSPKK